MHWRRKWQPTPVFLPGESQGRGSLVGCRLWSRTRRTRLKRLSSSSSSSASHDCVRLHRRQPTRLPRPWYSPGKNTGMGWHFLLQCMKAKSESEVTQSCPTCSNPMDCSLPGSSVHGIFQARVLEWGAIAFSALSSEPPRKPPYR